MTRATEKSAHIDFFPTLAELAGASLRPEVQAQIEGRSLLALLTAENTSRPERMLVTHLGRWEYNQATAAKHRQCAIRNSRFKLVNNSELCDLESDPAESRNVIERHPDVVTILRTAYDKWWQEILPCLENETVLGPPVNSFKAAYWQQFGGEPDDALRRRMEPSRKLPSRNAP
ncbi:MAG: hypothetical protein QHJ82_17410 [Verrucomicrobiota bacterium]|jgi:arylsulfatase|nr:hypothetical protein [Verrucomicrobiota bacterium]